MIRFLEKESLQEWMDNMLKDFGEIMRYCMNSMIT